MQYMEERQNSLVLPPTKWEILMLTHLMCEIISLVLLIEEVKVLNGLILCVACHPPLCYWYFSVKQIQQDRGRTVVCCE